MVLMSSMSSSHCGLRKIEVDLRCTETHGDEVMYKEAST